MLSLLIKGLVKTLEQNNVHFGVDPVCVDKVAISMECRLEYIQGEFAQLLFYKLTLPIWCDKVSRVTAMTAVANLKTGDKSPVGSTVYRSTSIMFLCFDNIVFQSFIWTIWTQRAEGLFPPV